MTRADSRVSAGSEEGAPESLDKMGPPAFPEAAVSAMAKLGTASFVVQLTWEASGGAVSDTGSVVQCKRWQ